jgi:TolA-binding protein
MSRLGSLWGSSASPLADNALYWKARLLIRLGDVPSARVALSKLIRDYPSTTEATQARRRLSEVEH